MQVCDLTDKISLYHRRGHMVRCTPPCVIERQRITPVALHAERFYLWYARAQSLAISLPFGRARVSHVPLSLRPRTFSHACSLAPLRACAALGLGRLLDARALQEN